MNIDKIAALHAKMESMGAFTAGHPSIPAAQTTPAYMLRLALDSPRSEAQRNGWPYFRMEASVSSEISTYKDEDGRRASGFIDEDCPERVAKWVIARLPGEGPVARLDRERGQELPATELYHVGVWRYSPTEALLRWGSAQDFEIALIGMKSYQLKRRRAEKKLLAQVLAFHEVAVQAKEREQLQRGQWLGATKALTTAPRVNEAGVPFLADAGLTVEQYRQLRYWAVPAGFGMSTAFPAGTGIALKVITASNQLIDGAVYLWQAEFGQPGEPGYGIRMQLGRLDRARKTHRGWIPLFGDDNPTTDLCCEAQWLKKPGRRWEGTIMQVVAYTTRAEQLAPATRQADARPLLRVQGREQSFALAA